VDRVRSTETAFVAVSQATTGSAAAGAIGGASSSERDVDATAVNVRRHVRSRRRLEPARQHGTLTPPIVSGTGTLSGQPGATTRTQILEGRLDALDLLVRQQQATIAEQAAAAKAQAAALVALQSRVDGLLAGARRRQ
jgi:hypothetical protein